MLNKKTIIILISSLLVVAGIIICYFFFFQKNRANIIGVSKRELTKCLDENKRVSYKSEDKEDVLTELTIFINNKTTEEKLFLFKIDNTYKTVPRLELHKCGIYVIRLFNYNPQKSKQDLGFKVEIWKYQYNGKGHPFFLLSEKKESGLTEGDYSYVFRIDPLEKYIVLEKGYLGKDDYSLIIKDIKTKEDIFTLSSRDLQRMNSNFIGVFDMLEWSEDGRYFWGSVSDGAYVNGYFRIDTQNWKADIYEAPDGAMGGSPLNINTGYLPIQPGQVWIGDYQLTEELKEQYRKEGKKSQLYLYNLFIKEKLLIETIDEPLFWFKSNWLSDTELEYELPTGEKKVYEVIIK